MRVDSSGRLQHFTPTSQSPDTATARPRTPATPAPDTTRRIPAWKAFIGAASTDLDRAQPAIKEMKPCVVVLGGSRGATRQSPATTTLGSVLGGLGLPVRVPDRDGDMAAVVAAAREESSDLHVEAIDRDTRPDLAADLRLSLRTHEIEKAMLMHGKATAFVVLPGGVEALYELFCLWTLMDTGLAPARPIVLVGDFWKKVLPPLVQAGLALGTVSQKQVDRVVFVDDAAEAGPLLAASHAKHRDAADLGLQRFRAAAQIDLMRLPPILDLFGESAVAFGSARMKPGSEPYRQAQRYGELAGGSVRTGAGPGIMEAVPAGAKTGDPAAHTEGINITLPHEQSQNPFIDPARSTRCRSIEMRQRLLLEGAASYAIFPGGTGTWFELFHLWQLMAAGELPERPILVTGFYREFLAGFLAEAGAAGLLSESEARVARERMLVADSVEELAARARAGRGTAARA